MNTQQKNHILLLANNLCAEDPSYFPKLIEIATDGVRKFAEVQSERATPLAFMLTAVLDNTKQDFPPFTRNEILEKLAPYFEGSPWWETNKPNPTAK